MSPAQTELAPLLPLYSRDLAPGVDPDLSRVDSTSSSHDQPAALSEFHATGPSMPTPARMAQCSSSTPHHDRRGELNRNGERDHDRDFVFTPTPLPRARPPELVSPLPTRGQDPNTSMQPRPELPISLASNPVSDVQSDSALGNHPVTFCFRDYLKQVSSEEIEDALNEEWNAPKPRHASLLKCALNSEIPNEQKYELWDPLAQQGWKTCIPSASIIGRPMKSSGFIQVFFDGGLNQQRMEIFHAVYSCSTYKQGEIEAVVRAALNLLRKIINKHLKKNLNGLTAEQSLNDFMEVCKDLHALSIAKINTKDFEVCDRAIGSGIGKDFIAGVEMSGLNSTEKVDPTQCSQAARSNVADNYGQLGVVILSPHVHFAQANVLGYPDTSG